MKSVLKTLTFLFFSGSLFLACEKSEEPLLPSDEGVGNVSFSFDATEENNGRAATNGRVSALVPNQIMLTIKSVDTQEVVYDKQVLDVIAFNGNYISDPISLKVGAYELVEYFVLDVNGTVIYLTPLAGSELAYLVDAPLAIGFDIAKDDSKQITPEVITPEGYDAADFGYTDFDFDVVSTIDFLMSVHFFDEVSESYELTDATVQVYGEGSLLFENELANATNQIRVRDEYESYTIVTTKPDFIADTLVLNNGELRFYQDEPLIVVLTLVQLFDVYANQNSVSGGVGLSVGTFYPGETITITCAEDDVWSWDTSGSATNANGAPDGLWPILGFEFRPLSLVGSFDGGVTYFKVGTNFETAVDSDTPVALTLHAWDSDKDNNSGFITASVVRQ